MEKDPFGADSKKYWIGVHGSEPSTLALEPWEWTLGRGAETGAQYIGPHAAPPSAPRPASADKARGDKNRGNYSDAAGGGGPKASAVTRAQCQGRGGRPPPRGPDPVARPPAPAPPPPAARRP